MTKNEFFNYLFTCRICGEHTIEKVRISDSLYLYKCANCGVLFWDATEFSSPVIGVKLLTSTATMPTKAHESDVAWDLFCSEEASIIPNETKLIHTDISLELPKNYETQVRSRSGLALHGITVANSPGTIDSGYRGEVCVILHNSTANEVRFNIGDRIGQLLITPKVHVNFQIVTELSKSDRGEDGFGSTGK